jgi:hypothetical protein
MAYTVGDIMLVRNICLTPSDGAINARHYRVSAVGGTGPTDQEAANVFATSWKPLYVALMAATATWFQTDIRRIFPLPLGATSISDLTTAVGSVIPDALPQQISGIITLHTALAGRAGRGRIYVPFPAEADSSGSPPVPLAGYITRLNALRDAMLLTLTTPGMVNNATFQPVIWHRASSTFTLVASATSRNYWATQRRRNNGRF